MALTGTDRGTGGNNTGAVSITITPTSNFSAGSFGVLCMAYDNTGGGGADPYSSISDSVGNTWTSRQNGLQDPGAAAAGITLRIFTSDMSVSKLTTANNITVSFGAVSVVAKSWTLHEWTTDAIGGFVEYVGGAMGAGAATSNPTITTTSIPSGNAVVGAGAAEASSGAWTGDADTTNGNWSAQQTAGFGTTTSGAVVTSQRKVVTGTATQTYNPTIAAVDRIIGWIELKETVASSFDPFGMAGFFGM